MRTAAHLFVFGLLTLTVGCLPDTSGVTPPDDTLIYPVGLAVARADGANRADPMADERAELLVVNSNFDLEYNAGTLVAVNLRALQQELDVLRADIAADGEVEGFRADYLGKDYQHIFVPVEQLIDPEETVRFGAFASDIALVPSEHPDIAYRALVPVRGERAVTIVDVFSGTEVLECLEDGRRRCDGTYRVESNPYYSLPIEPYEVTAAKFQEREGSTNFVYGFATHLAGGQVSAFVVEEGGQLVGELKAVASGVVPGASGIAVRHDIDDYAHEVLVAGRRDATPQVAVLRLLTDKNNEGSLLRDPYFGVVSQMSISSEMLGGSDARGLAVTSTGDTAFLVTRSPKALLRFDVNERELTDMTTLGVEPSVVEIYEHDVNETPEDPTDDALYVFVLCFLSQQVYIVDPITMQVVVRATGAGPHAIAFDKRTDRAFIANFRESTISIIQAIPPFDHEVVELPDPRCREAVGDCSTLSARVKIGKPRLPKGHS
jgi:DNA-binding beta-propeller fold protein YncE